MILSSLAILHFPHLQRVRLVGDRFAGYSFTLDLSYAEWARLRKALRRGGSNA